MIACAFAVKIERLVSFTVFDNPKPVWVKVIL
jgi:hypothetical protein